MNLGIVTKQLIRYQFIGEQHTLPKVPHGNSHGSTPYKRQPKSTRNLLKEQLQYSKSQEACRQVEEQHGGIKNNELLVSSLPRNTQQASICRTLFQSRAHRDLIMALIDVPKAVSSLHLGTASATSVLATDEQLRQLVLNCIRQDNFGVMHVDPTFNLGELFVTPIVFPLVNYMHRKSKGGCPTFIGPVLLHHQMQHSTYSYFLNHIISLMPEIKNVRAVGTDGELALCNALKESIPGAINLRCLKHIKDAIERKLNKLKFSSQSIRVIIADNFGSVTDGIRELGLSDAINQDDFFAKLMSLESKWNEMEMGQCHFLSDE